ncbi:MAG: hypothetical protein DDT40_01476 [candidate division WS2 bacterium]|nr:hypothetical protein [Candidatus Psychracetigena formicireducens]
MNEPSMTVNFSTRNLVKIALALQLAMLGAISLDFLDINIPLLRQSISFIYLSFVPGMLLLRVLKVHKSSAIETILYSAGLSLSFLMITGAMISLLFPLFGISKPISEIPLVITITIFVLCLCFVSYLRDKDYSISFSIPRQQLFSPPVLFSVLLPLLAVAGAYLLNFYANNILLLIFFGLVSIIPVLVAWNKVSKEIYPLIVWVTSIALLLHYTLLSPSVGIDAPSQVHYSNLVITSGFWNPQTPFTMYGKLSITMLIPLFSIIGEITPVWFLKVMYPLLLSFLPLGLYYIFRRQVSSDNNSDNNKIAFFSCFLFISTIHFIAFLSFGIRQGIAQIFLMLLILLMIDKTMQTAKRVILATIFAFSLIIS